MTYYHTFKVSISPEETVDDVKQQYPNATHVKILPGYDVEGDYTDSFKYAKITITETEEERSFRIKSENQETLIIGLVTVILPVLCVLIFFI